jgi:hypothetical protein
MPGKNYAKITNAGFVVKVNFLRWGLQFQDILSISHHFARGWISLRNVSIG